MIGSAKLAGLFLLLVVGGIGLPIPEDVTLVGAGALAQQRIVRLGDVIAVGLAGVVAADWIIYLFGRHYGAGIVAHPRLARLFGAERLEAVRETVVRRGAQAVFLARFIFGLRIVTFLSAGTFGVSAPRFAIAEGAASAIYVPAMTTLGFIFAHQAMRVAENVHRFERWLLLVGLVGLVLYFTLRARALRALTAAEPPRDGGAAPRDPRAPRDRPL